MRDLRSAPLALLALLGACGSDPAGRGERDASVARDAVVPGVDAFAEPSFDTTRFVIDDEGGLCHLSDDRRRLVVRIANAADRASPETALEIRTEGGPATRHAIPALAPDATATLEIDRAPLASYVGEWQFELEIDPDQLRAPTSPAPLAGSCINDLRERARRGTAVLIARFDEPSGLFDGNQWWTGANMMEVAVDDARELGDGSFLAIIQAAYDHARDDHDGNFLNEFYDDEGWWGLFWVKAYDLTHRPEYLDLAKTIFAEMTTGWSADRCNGGLYWNEERRYINAIPNELFLTLAARLHLRTPGDEGPGSYLDWAQREWAWFRASGMIRDDGQIVDGLNDACDPTGAVYTYNQGVILGGLVELWRATADASLLDAAERIAAAALQHQRDQNGVMIEAVCHPNCGEGDGVQFKGVFARNLALLYAVRPREEYRSFFLRQSDAIWNQARNERDELGKYWQGPFDMAGATRQSSALDAIVGAVRVADLNFAIDASATGSAPCAPSESHANAIDGNPRTKWCSGGTSGQTFDVDLGAARNIVGFRIQHAEAGGEPAGWNTREYEIETSTDGETWTRQVTYTGNVSAISQHAIATVRARYARLRITRAQTATDAVAARIYEFEVLGIER